MREDSSRKVIDHLESVSQTSFESPDLELEDFKLKLVGRGMSLATGRILVLVQGKVKSCISLNDLATIGGAKRFIIVHRRT